MDPKIHKLTPPAADRLRPMTSVSVQDDNTVVSEVTLQAHQSLFRGSLYPNASAHEEAVSTEAILTGSAAESSANMEGAKKQLIQEIEELNQHMPCTTAFHSKSAEKDREKKHVVSIEKQQLIQDIEELKQIMPCSAAQGSTNSAREKQQLIQELEQLNQSMACAATRSSTNSEKDVAKQELMRGIEEVNQIPQAGDRIENADPQRTIPSITTPGAYAMGGRSLFRGHSFFGSGGQDAPTAEENPQSEAAGEEGPVLQAVLAPTRPSSTTSAQFSNHRPEQAMVVVEAKSMEPGDEAGRMSKRVLLLAALGIIVLVVTVVLLSVGISGGFDDDDTMAGAGPVQQPNSTVGGVLDKPAMSTLEKIKARGYLRAAIFSNVVRPQDEIVGQSADIARAMAAGIFGEPKVEFLQFGIFDVFKNLVNETADIVISGLTHTMERDVYMSLIESPLEFSIPYAYEGLRVGGDPFYVGCADNGMDHIGECNGLQVCAAKGTTHYDAIRKYLPERHIVQIDMSVDGGLYGALIRGDCPVIAGETRGLERSYASERSWNGSYVDMDNFLRSESVFSREPIGAMMRQDDPAFTDFVNAIMFSLMAAEHQNVTQASAELLPETDLFGEQYKNVFRNAVGSVGNFGEIFQRNRKSHQSRNNFDRVNDGSTGMLYPHPLGSIDNSRDGLPLGKKLVDVLDRGDLRCGILMGRPGFATKVEKDYYGMDVDFCKAVAAALFGGNTDAVEFVEVEEDGDGYTLLASDEIDVLAGATWTLENDVKEPTTGKGYSFSPPYFYGYTAAKDNMCLCTRQDNPDWSSFVSWVVTGAMTAEDNGIDSSTFNEMPEVFVFGPDLRQMFRSLVLAVGSYAQIYERNLEALIPRGGRNVLNDIVEPGPQQYIIPGVL